MLRGEKNKQRRTGGEKLVKRERRENKRKKIREAKMKIKTVKRKEA